MNEKRYKSIVGLWGIIFLCIQAIRMIAIAGIFPWDYYSLAQRAYYSVIAIIIILLTVIFMYLSLKEEKIGPIIGMVIGGVFIATSFDVAYIIIGILFIFSCADLLQELGKKDEVVVDSAKEDKKEEKK